MTLAMTNEGWLRVIAKIAHGFPTGSDLRGCSCRLADSPRTLLGAIVGWRDQGDVLPTGLCELYLIPPESFLSKTKTN